MTRLARACAIGVFLAVAASCTPGTYRRDVTAIVSGPATVQVGGTVQLTVRLDYSDGETRLLTPTTMGPVEWSTSDAAIATVVRGAVRGVARGSAVITATPSVVTTGSGNRIAGALTITVQ
ncbi:MAG: Ig-like domain-containing protein [Acidobacteriota bacterium]|nr:Ig-like domain-containing protein [Acidobacteriota bacterium]